MLAVARRRLIRPNPFAFPGTNPGFNPAHVAGANVTTCAVPINGAASYFDLIGSRVGTAVTNAPTPSIIGTLGPSPKFLTATVQGVALAGKKSYTSGTNPLAFTMACFGMIVGTIATQSAFMAVGTATTDTEFPWMGTTVNSTTQLGIGVQAGTVVSFVAGIGLSVPFFFACSGSLPTNGASQTMTANMVMVNLNTGQTTATTGTSSQTTTTCTRNGTVNVGQRGTASLPGNAYLGPVMASDAFLSPAQLLEWAADPWAFWYPR